MYKDISKEFRVSVQTVCILVAKAKKKPEFIREIHAKRDATESKSNSI